MKSLIPYIYLKGRSEEALVFYQACFDGEVTLKMLFSDGPEMPGVTGEYLKKVMHAEFKAEGVSFMLSDGMPDEDGFQDSNISLCIEFDNEERQTQIFNALTEGGAIIMELEETFWGARFGQVMDKFGVKWMLNCPKS